MEIGLAVGGAFLSSALNVLFDRLAPHGDLLKMFQNHKNDIRLLKKLRMTLLGLQAVLSDAENKQASNRSVREWFNELRDAVDSAENLMEEVNYEALRLKVEGQHQNLAGTSNQQVSDLNLFLSDDFLLNIKEKLEETIEILEVLEKQIGRLGLKEHFGSTKQETRKPSTSLVDESDVFGRQNEIEDLIDRLLSKDANGKNLTVVPIVGMGGVGKTTIAKAVYNDEKLKDHFCLKAWFCVSEAYDAFRITKGLLQEIGSFDLKVDDNLNQLQVKLKERLSGKKFLVVLDDVWNDNYNEWDDLRNLFVQGDIGSKIIVTTRKESVALMIGNEKISIDNLSIEVSWSLFKRHAFENMDPMEHPELEEIGKQIAAKCKGLPLALKTLAGMLRSKSTVEEWKRILRSEIWELPDKDILPALMLSYNDLPAHLKQCFSYCAIFPKDYPFRKEQVIHLWIANGLVPREDEIIHVMVVIKLEVDGSPKVGVLFDEAELFTSQLQGMKQIDELCLADCNSLTSLPFSILPTTLKSIEISGCRKLKLEAPVGEMFLEDLSLIDCGSIDDISCEMVPRARTLKVESCHNFTRFLIPTGTEGVDIRSCENVEILSVACGTQMTSLHIYLCKKLKQLPDRMQELLPSLNRLKLRDCAEIESFPEGGLPFHLQELHILDCEKLVNNRKEWRLERLPCLRGLSIYHNGSDEEIVAGNYLKFSHWWKKVFPRLFLSYGYLTSIHYRAKVSF